MIGRQILSLSAGAGHGSLKREKISSPSLNTRFLPADRFPGVGGDRCAGGVVYVVQDFRIIGSGLRYK